MSSLREMYGEDQVRDGWDIEGYSNAGCVLSRGRE